MVVFQAGRHLATVTEEAIMHRTIPRAASGALLAGMVLLGLGVAPASPANAAVIKCSTAVTYNKKAKKTTARVISNYPSKAAVHSFVFAFSNGDVVWTRTYDKRTNRGRGYGPALTVNGYSYQATGWQSGTRCTTGGVRHAG
jgi:hypothetical protein